MSKNIQIPMSLFIDMIKLIKDDELSQQERVLLESIVIPQIDEKLDRIISHENFSKYKSNTNPDDKEKLLREYLKRYDWLNIFMYIYD